MAGKRSWVPTFRKFPREWAPHPQKKMLMTPWMVLVGGLFAFAIPTMMGAFFQMFFFNPPVSDEWAPLSASAERGRQIFVANGCLYCHSGFSRPQDVQQGLYYLYSRISLPGDYATSDTSPNLFGTARIGPDLSNESGQHPIDWERAHLNDPRFVNPVSIMPSFAFLSDQDVEDLSNFVDTRSGKSGLIRMAGQEYMKKVLLAAGNVPEPPTGYTAMQMSLADVANAAANAPSPPAGNYDGLAWPDPVNLNIVDRGYWLTSNPLPVTTDNLNRGRMIFQENCIGCHGQGGAAVSNAAKFLRPTPIDFTSPDDAGGANDTAPGVLYYRILRGIPGSGMENFGTRLRVDDIWKVVLFLKTIPNGGLQGDKELTPDMYIQWKPPDTLSGYIAKHAIDQNKELTENAPPTDPFELEARRVLAGLNTSDSFVVPGYGPVSLDQAARDIQAIYEDMLDQGWQNYVDSGGNPIPSQDQRNALPDLTEELR
ncbi:MAG: cbb3-type cytochrome c oxidase subunit II [Thermoleophilia bacterium]